MLFFLHSYLIYSVGGSGENDENLLAGNGEYGETKGGRIREPVVCSITPIRELNQGATYYKFPRRCYETLFIDDELSDV